MGRNKERPQSIGAVGILKPFDLPSRTLLPRLGLVVVQDQQITGLDPEHSANLLDHVEIDEAAIAAVTLVAFEIADCRLANTSQFSKLRLRHSLAVTRTFPRFAQRDTDWSQRCRHEVNMRTCAFIRKSA